MWLRSKRRSGGGASGGGSLPGREEFARPVDVLIAIVGIRRQPNPPVPRPVRAPVARQRAPVSQRPSRSW